MHVIRSVTDASANLRARMKIASVALLLTILPGIGHTQQQKPDLTVTGITFVGGVRNGPCNKVRVTFRNSQNVGVSQTFRVKLIAGFSPEAGAIYERELSQTGIGPGASLSLTFSNVPNVAVIAATVDSGNQITEAVETNNSKNFGGSLSSTTSCTS